MDDLEILHNVLNVIENSEIVNNLSPMPIFSLEGLPGAGKTTQFDLVTKSFPSDLGNLYSFKTPSFSPFGKILRLFYSDREKWNDLKSTVSWLNPVLISADLKFCIDKAYKDGFNVALMTRGLLSTIYFNKCNYIDKKNFKYLKAYYKPKIIFFLDIDEELAYKRVFQRKRSPVRQMDSLEQMRKDIIFLKKQLCLMDDIIIKYIDATLDKHEITKIIINEIKKYLTIKKAR